MGFWQEVWGLQVAVLLVLAWATHGTVKTLHRRSAWRELTFWVIQGLILWLGGFFAGGPAPARSPAECLPRQPFLEQFDGKKG